MKKLFKIMGAIENTIAFTFVVIGSFLVIGQTGDIKQEIIINLIGLGMLAFGLWDLS